MSKNKKTIIILTFLIFVAFAIPIASAWWDVNWEKSWVLEINNTDTISHNNTPVTLNVTNETFVECIATDMNDLRVIWKNVTEINFDWYNASDHIGYPQIAFLINSTAGTTNYDYQLYCHNPTAIDNSGGVFLLWDSFDFSIGASSNKWINTGDSRFTATELIELGNEHIKVLNVSTGSMSLAFKDQFNDEVDGKGGITNIVWEFPYITNSMLTDVLANEMYFRDRTDYENPTRFQFESQGDDYIYAESTLNWGDELLGNYRNMKIEHSLSGSLSKLNLWINGSHEVVDSNICGSGWCNYTWRPNTRESYIDNVFVTLNTSMNNHNMTDILTLGNELIYNIKSIIRSNTTIPLSFNMYDFIYYSANITDTDGFVDNVNMRCTNNGNELFNQSNATYSDFEEWNSTSFIVLSGNTNCSVFAEDNSSGISSTSFTFDINNNLPVIDSVNITPDSPIIGNNLNCSVLATDLENSTLVFNFSWKVNSTDRNDWDTSVQCLNNSLCYADLAPTDVGKYENYTCLVSAGDGYNYSSPTLSDQKNVSENLAPTILFNRTILANGTPVIDFKGITRGQSLIVQVNVSEPDVGDFVDSVAIQIKTFNGSVFTDTNATFDIADQWNSTPFTHTFGGNYSVLIIATDDNGIQSTSEFEFWVNTTFDFRTSQGGKMLSYAMNATGECNAFRLDFWHNDTGNNYTISLTDYLRTGFGNTSENFDINFTRLTEKYTQNYTFGLGDNFNSTIPFEINGTICNTNTSLLNGSYPFNFTINSTSLLNDFLIDGVYGVSPPSCSPYLYDLSTGNLCDGFDCDILDFKNVGDFPLTKNSFKVVNNGGFACKESNLTLTGDCDGFTMTYPDNNATIPIGGEKNFSFILDNVPEGNHRCAVSFTSYVADFAGSDQSLLNDRSVKYDLFVQSTSTGDTGGTTGGGGGGGSDDKEDCDVEIEKRIQLTPTDRTITLNIKNNEDFTFIPIFEIVKLNDTAGDVSDQLLVVAPPARIESKQSAEFNIFYNGSDISENETLWAVLQTSSAECLPENTTIEVGQRFVFILPDVIGFFADVFGIVDDEFVEIFGLSVKWWMIIALIGVISFVILSFSKERPFTINLILTLIIMLAVILFIRFLLMNIDFNALFSFNTE